MTVLIDPRGDIRCLYHEAVDLASLGTVSILRASHVEPDEQGQWWADLAPMLGPWLGPFPLRSQALEAECAWLEAWLVASRLRCNEASETKIPNKSGEET